MNRKKMEDEEISEETGRSDSVSFEQDKTEQVSPSDYFLKLLERESLSLIPTYVKNILRLNNFLNPMAFRHISEDTIKEMETFARDEMEFFLKPEDHRQDYYHNYHTCPAKFQFVMGDKHLLLELAKIVETKPLEFWKMPERSATPSQQKKLSQLYTSGKASSSNFSVQVEKGDTEDERKTLSKIVKKILEDNDGENMENKCKRISTQDLEIQVSISENYGEDGFPQSYTYRANIKCPKCSFITKLTKCGHIGQRGSKWVLSNFRRHIKSHQNLPTEKSKKRKSSSIVEVLRASKCNKLESNTLDKPNSTDERSIKNDKISEFIPILYSPGKGREEIRAIEASEIFRDASENKSGNYFYLFT
ncbi:uncharacterized protein [Venturia canescens]|uniref:uncharacterized protein n=1 Tax=Venturia canescens TaxID=32260 RepID=UPI001C9C9E23|nr:uncharacterized protein LOC122408564 [Venturia canescens]